MRMLPPLEERLAAGRPVITRDQALAVMQQIMAHTTIANAGAEIEHVYHGVTRLAHGAVRSTNDGDYLRIGFRTSRAVVLNVYVETNQFDDQSIRAVVERAEALLKDMIGSNEELGPRQAMQQDRYLPTALWHEPSIAAIPSVRTAEIPKILETVRARRLQASGMVGIMARAMMALTRDGITAFHEETDCEVNVTARPDDGTSSGWSGQASRDWSQLDPVRVATDAADIAERGLHPSAVEPGRRVAILGPAAVVQLMRFLVLHFDGEGSDNGGTGFSKVPGRPKGSRFLQRLFDPRVHITVDPTDPLGGYQAWFGGLVGASANPALTLIEGGVLKNLTYRIMEIALQLGRPYSDLPHGLHMQGGETTVAQMIAQCDEGIYVNRFSSVDVVDMQSGMLTGVTRDGCFLIKHGKIDRPVKNFRFLTSPFFFLNNILAMGPTQRAAFGYAPPTMMEREVGIPSDWPRRPMIVPPLMVRDFNFNALIDAV